MSDEEKKKKTLELSTEKNYLAFQNICLPLAVILSDKKLQNWYHLNYMNPVVRLDGVSSLQCNIVDAFAYGAGANIYSKLVRTSSINIDVCKYIRDIRGLLEKKIDKGYYCILFLDFYYLKCSKHCNQVKHYTHELLFYGYDKHASLFKCYGYIDTIYQCVELSYEEVENGYFSALEYINLTDGWEEYMLMTLQKVEHKISYPYSNKVFIDKLNSYVQGEISDLVEYENLLYLNKMETTDIAFGVRVTDVISSYIDILIAVILECENYDKFVSQLSAINMYEFYHMVMYENIKYFMEINQFQKYLSDYVEQYYLKVVKMSNIIRMLYLKLGKQIGNNISSLKTLEDIRTNLKQIKIYENNILCNYINEIEKLIG